MSNMSLAVGAPHSGGQSIWHFSGVSAGKLFNGFDDLSSRVVTWVVGACNIIKDLWATLLQRITLFFGLDSVFLQPESAPPAPAREQAWAAFAESRAQAQLARARTLVERLAEARPWTLAEALALSLTIVVPVQVGNRPQGEVLIDRQPFQIIGLSEVQLLSLSEDDVQSIHHDALFKLPQSIQDNLGFGKINKLSTEEVENLTSHDLNSLEPISIYGIDSSIIDALSEECIKGLNAFVFNHLNLMTIASIDTSILRKISPTTLRGLKSRFLNALPLDPSTLINDDRKRRLSAQAVRWKGQDLCDVLALSIQGHIRSGQRLFWVDA